MFACIEIKDNELKDLRPVSVYDFAYSLQDRPELYFKVVGDYTKEGFARNYGGHPRSDVALLNEQNDMQYVQQILNRLNERPSDGVGSDVSDIDLSLRFKSKYCQSPSEMIQYFENLLEQRDNAELARLEGEEQEKRAQELKEQREKLRATLTPDEKEYLRKKLREREVESLIDV